MARKAGEIHMKKHRKAKKVVRITILLCIILVVYSLWGRAWPRRWFICPGEFFHLTNPNPEFGSSEFFPEKLPASAENPRYLYDESFFGFSDNINGISFTLDEKEYRDMKESYLSYFKEREAEWDGGWLEFDEEVTAEFLEEEKLDYLDYLFHGSEDSYTVLAYVILPNHHYTYYLKGVICNDDRNEMIIFDIKDGIRKEKRDTES